MRGLSPRRTHRRHTKANLHAQDRGPAFASRHRSNQPVTAQTFKDSIERPLTARMHGPATQYVADVIRARRYTAEKARHVAGVVASGDTLTTRLLAPGRAAETPTNRIAKSLGSDQRHSRNRLHATEMSRSNQRGESPDTTMPALDAP
jgi:hypothetical protein